MFNRTSSCPGRLIAGLFFVLVANMFVRVSPVLAATCEEACALANEAGFTEAESSGTASQCCCMPDENGTIVSQPVDLCQAPQQ